MTKSNQPIPPGHEHLIPHLVCANCTEALKYYEKALGAQTIHAMPGPDGRIMHAAMRVGDSIMFLADDFPEYCNGASQTPIALKGTPVTIHRYVKDCDAAIKQSVDAGATLLMPAADMFWGDRYGSVTDPYGHRWSFATHQHDLSDAELQQAVTDAFAQAPQ